MVATYGGPTYKRPDLLFQSDITVKRIVIFSVLLASLLLSGCAKEEIQRHGPVASVPGGKIVNTKGSDFKNDMLLVKFASAPDSAALEALRLEGVVSVERALPSTPGKEELEARFGLDLWYAVRLGEKADAELLAEKFAEADAVSAVQYSMNYSKASDCKSYPYRPGGGHGVMAATAPTAVSSGFNDPMLGDQWHYNNTGTATVASSAYRGGDINVKDVWADLTCGDPDIIVAVVDEGVKYTHPDLAANMWTNPGETEDGADNDHNGKIDDIHGWNFVSDGPISWDRPGDTGHGTHCAGTIAAVNNNNLGVSGVAGGSGKGDGVRIMSCQIFDNDRGGSSVVVANAIKYAADNGASVISCSFGYAGGAFMSDSQYKNGNYGTNLLEYEAIKYFEATRNNDVLDGSIAIFAAGNDALPYSGYPGALNDIISVSAFGPDYLPAYYTNYGPGCNITAPGGEAYLNPWTERSMVLSTLPSEINGGEDYGYMQGTSMACPHVSGVVALGLSYAKQLGMHYSVQQFKEMILASANDFETRLASGRKDYASGSESYFNSVPLGNYRKQMGTGSIDAWRLMMKIEGTPCLTAEAGSNQWLDLSEYFGSASINLTYLDVECLGDGYDAIGLAEEPYIRYGRLYIHPTRCGAAKFKVTAVGGGTAVGGDSAIGGMEISQEVSVVVRSVKSSNGGWL